MRKDDDKTSSIMPGHGKMRKDDEGERVCPLERTCGLGEHRCALEMDWRNDKSYVAMV